MAVEPTEKTGSSRLVIVTGKGGTGKSAVAAAQALCQQRAGRKVLAVSMTGGADGLAAHLGIPPLEFEPTEARPGLFALAVERSKALTEYLQTQIGLPHFVGFGPFMRAFDALASAAPAIREIVTIGKVLYEVKTGHWDVVVADAPPTGQIGSHLRAARTITELVPTGRIREQASWMQQTLRESTLAIVTLAEELPAAETAETLAWLASEQLVDDIEVIGNRLLPPLAIPERFGTGSVAQAARLHTSLLAEQERWLREVPVDRSLPYLFGIMTPSEVAAKLADEIEAWE